MKTFLSLLDKEKAIVLEKKFSHKLKSLNLNLPIIKSPISYVSKHSVIGEGTIIMHGAIVNAGAKVGVNCILNTQSSNRT
jgi:UDP-3-O-[3-hydroxymyristoyl] glucosamine N-acyltransferase